MKTVSAYAIIKTDFTSFFRKVFKFKNGFSLGDQPYLDHACHEVDRFLKGEFRNLAINMPPRCGKTLLCSVSVPAWVLGHNPSAEVIVVAGSENLTKDIAGDVRDVMQSEWYELTFATRLHPDRMRVCDFQTTRGGGLLAASVDMNITGRGATIIACDDLLDIADANNVARMKQIIKHFGTGIRSRLNNRKTGKILMIGHRLHELDPFGHVLEEGWHHVVLPLVAPRDQTYDLGYGVWRRPEGDILRPDSYDEEEIERLRTSEDFEMLYQQSITCTTRIRIDRDHFKLISVPYYRTLPVVLSVDTAQGEGRSASYNVIQAWVQPQPGNHLVLDQWRLKCRSGELESAFWDMVRRFRPAACLIEDAANGSSLIDRASRKKWLNVIPIIPDGRSKAARLLAHIDAIQGGHIHLPATAPWRECFIFEFLEFPRGSDDQVDAATQYLDFVATNPSLVAPPPRLVGGLGGGRWPGQFSNSLDLQRIGPVAKHYRDSGFR
jgi:predicted phage terminase large subunit-like protein